MPDVATTNLGTEEWIHDETNARLVYRLHPYFDRRDGVCPVARTACAHVAKFINAIRGDSVARNTNDLLKNGRESDIPNGAMIIKLVKCISCRSQVAHSSHRFVKVIKR